MQDINKCHCSAINDPPSDQNAMSPGPESLTANCKNNNIGGCSTEKIYSSDSINGPSTPDPLPVIRPSLIEISLQRRISAQNNPDIGREIQKTVTLLPFSFSSISRRLDLWQVLKVFFMFRVSAIFFCKFSSIGGFFGIRVYTLTALSKLLVYYFWVK